MDYGMRRTNSWFHGWGGIPSTDYSGSGVEAIGLLNFRRYQSIGTGYYGSTEWTLQVGPCGRPDVWPADRGPARLLAPHGWQPLGVPPYGSQWRRPGCGGLDRRVRRRQCGGALRRIENSEVLASATCPVTVSEPSLALWRTRFRIHCTPPNGSMLFPTNINVGPFQPDVTVQIGSDVMTTDFETGISGFFGPMFSQYSRWDAGRRVGILYYRNGSNTGPSASHYE